MADCLYAVSYQNLKQKKRDPEGPRFTFPEVRAGRLLDFFKFYVGHVVCTTTCRSIWSRLTAVPGFLLCLVHLL